MAEVLAKEGAEHNVTANLGCPGFVRTPLVDKQIPKQAKQLAVTEEQVVKTIMLKDTVDTTTEERCRRRALFRGFQDVCPDGPVHRRQPRLVHE